MFAFVSLRALYGTAIMQNAVHGSAVPDDAQREISLIFGSVAFDEEGKVVKDDEEEGGEREA